MSDDFDFDWIGDALDDPWFWALAPLGLIVTFLLIEIGYHFIHGGWLG